VGFPGADLVTACLLFLPAGLVVMCLAAYTLLRDTSQARSPDQVQASAVTGCRLGVLSSVLIALAGIGCLDGPVFALGSVMIVLGVSGATAGCLFFRRYLAATDRSRPARHR
jgi:hypothetical protein